jgi:hypothetical protein
MARVRPRSAKDQRSVEGSVRTALPTTAASRMGRRTGRSRPRAARSRTGRPRSGAPEAVSLDDRGPESAQGIRDPGEVAVLVCHDSLWVDGDVIAYDHPLVERRPAVSVDRSDATRVSAPYGVAGRLARPREPIVCRGAAVTRRQTRRAGPGRSVAYVTRNRARICRRSSCRAGSRPHGRGR